MMELFVKDKDCPECEALLSALTWRDLARIRDIRVLADAPASAEDHVAWAEADFADIVSTPTLAAGNARYHGKAAIVERLRSVLVACEGGTP